MAETEKQANHYHLCIVNLVIGTLYCSKNNYDFGVGRIVKSLEPIQKKVIFHLLSSIQILGSTQSDAFFPSWKSSPSIWSSSKIQPSAKSLISLTWLTSTERPHRLSSTRWNNWTRSILYHTRLESWSVCIQRCADYRENNRSYYLSSLLLFDCTEGLSWDLGGIYVSFDGESVSL